MAESKILRCSCTHEFQDKTYGKGMRLMNPTGKTQDSGYRCTVCGKEINPNSNSKKR